VPPLSFRLIVIHADSVTEEFLEYLNTCSKPKFQELTLLSLPPELLHKIVEEADLNLSLMLSCKLLNQALTMTQVITRLLYMETLGSVDDVYKV
jgi:hypothetical protein